MPISKIKSSAIDANAITGAGIADGTVDTADLANGAVTSAKLDTNIDIAGTLDVTGATTLDNTLSVGSNTNLLTNGDFTTDTTGWTANGSSLASVSGELELTPNLSVNGFASQQVDNLVVGRSYIASFTVTVDAASYSRLYIGTTVTGNEVLSNLNLGVGTHSFSFVATATTHYFTIVVGGGTGQVTRFDNARLYEASSITFPAASGNSPAIVQGDSVNSLAIKTNNTHRMTINNSGHIGIGTTEPTIPLDVVTSGGGNFVARFQNTTSATPYNVWVKDAPSTTNGYPLLQVTDDAGTGTYFRVDSGTGKISAGKMTHFVASGPTGWFTISNGSNTKIDYTGEILDAAGTYDASTSRFTATVAGWYRFEHHMYARLQGSQGDNTNYWWGGFLKNGAAVALNGVTQNITGYQNDGDYDNFSIATAYLNLSIGDYVEAYGRAAGPSNGEVYRGHSLFVGQQLIV